MRATLTVTSAWNGTPCANVIVNMTIRITDSKNVNFIPFDTMPSSRLSAIKTITT